MDYKKIFFLVLLIVQIQTSIAQSSIPHLDKAGNSTYLMVNNNPYPVLGGELGNSTFTSVKNMSPHWETLQQMNINTVLAPVYWELVEPEEGKFDFSLLGDLVDEARKHDMKLVILWFGSWKNSMSTHVPSWIKKNQNEYPRAKDEKGVSQEILSPFYKSNLQADKNAFVALMQYIRKIDEKQNTIIMVQPENEIGMLPSARDYSPKANELFQEKVPGELVDYLVKNKELLIPEFRELWSQNGYKTDGNWEEIFGGGFQTDELFMAWYYSKFTEEITKAGKEIYPLPMFVNAALIRPGKIPGEYPSAGPLPHLMDIWKAGAPSIDFLSPDFYTPNFEKWCDLYTRQNNPLFVPEHRFDTTVGPKALFTFGHYEGIGFSPFGIESRVDDGLKKAYDLIQQLSPLIYENFGQNKIDGVLLDREKIQTTVVLGDYELSFKNSYTLGWEAGATNEVWDSGGAIIIQTGESEFYIGGSGVVVTFKNWRQKDKNVGILKTDEGFFDNGKWKVIRHLNGDQTHQGRHIRIGHGAYAIQRFTLYQYE